MLPKRDLLHEHHHRDGPTLLDGAGWAMVKSCMNDEIHYDQRQRCVLLRGSRFDESWWMPTRLDFSVLGQCLK